MKKTKVCMLVAAHPLKDARIFKKEAKSLLKKGYDVTMIVPRIRGHLLDVDGRFLNIPETTFVYEGIKIRTFDFFAYQDQLKQMLMNVQMGRYEGFADPLTQLGIAENADIYHAHEFPSFYSGVGIKRALKARNGKNVKLIYDSHEVDPDPLNPIHKKYEPLMLAILRMMLKEVDYIVTVSEKMKAWYYNMNPHLSMDVIYNSPPIEKTVKKEMNPDYFTIVHEGAITNVKGNFEKMKRIIEICLENNVPVKFKIIGGIYGTKTTLKIPSHLANHIEETGWVDFATIPYHMRDGQMGWIDFEDLHLSLNRQYAMPNKFFSYLNAGVPILVNKSDEMVEFIQKHRCGVVVLKASASAEDYAKVIMNYYHNQDKLEEMSQKARSVIRHYSWERMEEKLAKIYEQVLKK